MGSAPGTLAQRRCRSLGGWSWQEPVHEGVAALIGILMAFVSQVEVEHRGFELGVPQVSAG